MMEIVHGRTGLGNPARDTRAKTLGGFGDTDKLIN